MPEVEAAPWRESHLVCGIGHRYRGRVRQVRWTTTDMDGELIWHGPDARYDPERCVVCGLITYKEGTNGTP